MKNILLETMNLYTTYDTVVEIKNERIADITLIINISYKNTFIMFFLLCP